MYNYIFHFIHYFSLSFFFPSFNLLHQLFIFSLYLSFFFFSSFFSFLSFFLFFFIFFLFIFFFFYFFFIYFFFFITISLYIFTQVISFFFSYIYLVSLIPPFPSHLPPFSSLPYPSLPTSRSCSSLVFFSISDARVFSRPSRSFTRSSSSP